MILNILPEHSFIQSVFILSDSYLQLVVWVMEDPGAQGWVLGHLSTSAKGPAFQPTTTSFVRFSLSLLVTACDPTCRDPCAGFCHHPTSCWNPGGGSPGASENSFSHGKQQHMEGPGAVQAFWKVCALPGVSMSSTSLPCQTQDPRAKSIMMG